VAYCRTRVTLKNMGNLKNPHGSSWLMVKRDNAGCAAAYPAYNLPTFV